jgi:DNA-binding PadR family transcriptional regulator
MDGRVSNLGRFSDPVLFILVSSADGKKHGYAMMEDIEVTCGLRLGPGTLYGALSRLEKRG